MNIQCPDWPPAAFLFRDNNNGAKAQLSLAMLQMNTYIDDFAAALKLIESVDKSINPAEPFTEDHWTRLRWKYMAARDGAMSVYHFEMARQQANRLLAQCSELSEVVDAVLRKGSNKAFLDRFPSYIGKCQEFCVNGRPLFFSSVVSGTAAGPVVAVEKPAGFSKQL